MTETARQRQGRASRRKGGRVERELVKLLNEAGIPAKKVCEKWKVGQ